MLILSLAMALMATDPDGVVATAPATPLALDATAGPVAPPVDSAGVQAAAHGLTTDEQIDRWIEARSPDNQPFTSDVGDEADERKVHGYVEAGIGSGGYHSYGGGVSVPLGEDGRLDLHYRKTEGEGIYGYPDYGRPGYGYGYGPSRFDGGYGGFGSRGRSTSFDVGARWDQDARRDRRHNDD